MIHGIVIEMKENNWVFLSMVG